MHKLSFFTFLLSAALCAWGYPTGAPLSACESMVPGHGPHKPQEDKFPYSVSISKKNLQPGEETDITISGKDFKGFFVQVRRGNEAVGSFITDPEDKEYSTIPCNNNQNSAAIQTSASVKKEVILKYKAPQDKGDLRVFVTMVADFSTFWAKVDVGTITVS